MSSDLFTHLLIERLRELTDLNKTREQIEDEYRAFETAIKESRTDAKTLDRIRQEVTQIRTNLPSLGETDARDEPRYPQEKRDREQYSQGWRLVLERLNAIDSRLDELNLLSRVHAQLERIEKYLNLAEQNQGRREEDTTALDQELIYPFEPIRAIINEYFLMDQRDFQALTPEIHIWFLERVLRISPLATFRNLHRLRQVYFEKPVGILRYLVIRVLCRFDSKDLFEIRQIGQAIIERYATKPERELMYRELVNILIDLGSERSRQALLSITNQARNDNIGEIVEKAIRDRENELGQGNY